MAQTVKSLPAMQETQVQSLGWENPLKKGMAAHPSILAWRIPWTEEPGGLQSTGSDTTEWLTHMMIALNDFSFFTIYLFIWLYQALVVALGILVASCSSLSLCCTGSLAVTPWTVARMWDLSPPTRDQTPVPCIVQWTLNHWTTRKVPAWFF